jgi:hypothetical protein
VTGELLHSTVAQPLCTQVMASARLLLTLINNMLDVRKMETVNMSHFELLPTPLAQCLTDAADFCMPFAALNEVCLHPTVYLCSGYCPLMGLKWGSYHTTVEHCYCCYNHSGHLVVLLFATDTEHFVYSQLLNCVLLVVLMVSTCALLCAVYRLQ